MKKRLIILSIIYIALLIALSFCWKNLNFANSQKGDETIICIAFIATITLIYSVISKLIIGRSFLVTPMVITPFVSFTISIIALLIINASLGGLTDYVNLQVYFYLNGIAAIAYVLLVANYSIKRNSARER